MATSTAWATSLLIRLPLSQRRLPRPPGQARALQGRHHLQTYRSPTADFKEGYAERLLQFLSVSDSDTTQGWLVMGLSELSTERFLKCSSGGSLSTERRGAPRRGHSVQALPQAQLRCAAGPVSCCITGSGNEPWFRAHWLAF